MRDHRAALDFDCMTKTGRTLGEYEGMGAAGLVALSHFTRYLDADSALWRELNPSDETPMWTDRPSTNAILADIYDALSTFNTNYVSHHSKRSVRRQAPYPRPNAKKSGKEIGKGAIPAREFMDWWESG